MLDQLAQVVARPRPARGFEQQRVDAGIDEADATFTGHYVTGKGLTGATGWAFGSVTTGFTITSYRRALASTEPFASAFFAAGFFTAAFLPEAFTDFLVFATFASLFFVIFFVENIHQRGKSSESFRMQSPTIKACGIQFHIQSSKTFLESRDRHHF